MILSYSKVAKNKWMELDTDFFIWRGTIERGEFNQYKISVFWHCYSSKYTF